jgi:hypothetical protein
MLAHHVKKINPKPVLSCNLKPNIISSDSQLIITLPVFNSKAPKMGTGENGVRTNAKEKIMTLSPLSIRFGALIGAVVASGTLLFAAPQAYAASGPYYQVELAQPAAMQKQYIRGVFVKCEGTACRAPLAASAPKNVCISIAREFGEVAAFTAGNRVFDATEVAACNEKNKMQVAKK